MFSIVYVLTSNSKDFYYEQMMISIESVKYQMPDQKIIVITDKNTYASLVGTRKSVFAYADVIKVNTPKQLSNKEISRYLKTSLRKYVKGDILFVDCDTVICDDFSSFTCEQSIAMVLDMHIPFSELEAADINGYNKIKNRMKCCDFSLDGCKNYYNSGVIWIKDDKIAADFFEKWHSNWEKTMKMGIVEDQISLNYTNVLLNNVIMELPGQWNCQTTFRIRGLKYMHDAHIIHYYNVTDGTSAYALCDEKMIRSYNNKVHAKLTEIIHEPKFAFKEGILVSTNLDGIKLMNSRQLRLLRLLCDRANSLFKFNEKLLEIFSKIRKNK